MQARHQLILLFFNLTGTFNYVFKNSFSVSRRILIKNIIFILIFAHFRVYFHIFIRNQALRKNILLVSNVSKFYHVFTISDIIFFQASGFLYIATQIWYRHEIVEFLNICLQLKLDVNSQVLQKFEKKVCNKC